MFLWLLEPRYPKHSAAAAVSKAFRDSRDSARVAERTKPFKTGVSSLLQQGLRVKTIPSALISAIQALLPDRQGSGVPSQQVSQKKGLGHSCLWLQSQGKESVESREIPGCSAWFKSQFRAQVQGRGTDSWEPPRGQNGLELELIAWWVSSLSELLAGPGCAYLATEISQTTMCVSG